MTVRPKKKIPQLGVKWHRAILFLAALGMLAALIGPIFADALGKGITSTTNHVTHFRDSGLFWMASIVIAILLSAFLPETGPKRNKA